MLPETEEIAVGALAGISAVRLFLSERPLVAVSLSSVAHVQPCNKRSKQNQNNTIQEKNNSNKSFKKYWFNLLNVNLSPAQNLNLI